jgi:hypothetical protein
MVNVHWGLLRLFLRLTAADVDEGGASPAISVVSTPRLKHQHVPQKVLPVALSGLVLAPFCDDRLWLEQAT